MQKLTASLFLIASLLLFSATPGRCSAFIAQVGTYKGHLEDGRAVHFRFHGVGYYVNDGQIEGFRVTGMDGIGGGGHRTKNLHFSWTMHGWTRINGVLTPTKESASGHWKTDTEVVGVLIDHEGKHYSFRAHWAHSNPHGY